MATTASVKLLENASATGGWFTYPGGWTVASVVGTFPGTVVIEVQGPDGVTPLPVISFTSSQRTSSTNVLGLAPGLYRATVAGGATAVYATMERVPE